MLMDSLTRWSLVRSGRRALSLAMVSTLVAACGAPAPSTQPAPTSRPSTGGAATAAPAAQNASQTGSCPAGATKGGTLVMARGSDSQGFDPPAETSGESIKVLDNLYNGLVRAGQNGEILPDLASSWNVSPDGLTYTFNLRTGVKFHDGTDFNADAVKFSFDRPFNKEDPSYLASMSQATGFTFTSVKAVDAVDPKTVKITLKEPNAAFLNNLSTAIADVVSPAAVKKFGKDFRENPVGTGPYKFVSWTRNQQVELARNPDYFLKDCPLLDKVIFRVIPDNTVRLQELKTGAVQLADSLAPTDVAAIKGDSNLKLYQQPAPIISIINFKLTKDPWKDVRVRQAVAAAIDLPTLVKALYADTAVPATGPLLPGLLGYDASFKPYAYDVNKAKQLLAQAGFPNGLDANLWIQNQPRNYNAVGTRLAEAVQTYLTAAGIRTKIVAQEPATFNAAVADPNNNEIDMFIAGWWSDNGAQNYFINSYFITKAPFNRTGYGNPEVDKLLAQAESTTDDKKRVQLYQDAQKLIVADVPGVPLAFTQAMQGASASLQNVNPPSFGAGWRFDQVWLKK